ncbi:MAG TPA: BrnT family toxin [Syntrophobacteraceae bacterium]|nr:BrnT family toxin [Syntrophobacteraceae bacterium]
MRYTWTEEKNRKNIRRHGIAFEDAKRIFEGPTLERIDDRFDYGEVRVYAIGLVNGLEITVIYTDRSGGERRIISAWRAEPHERRYYRKKIETL